MIEQDKWMVTGNNDCFTHGSGGKKSFGPVVLLLLMLGGLRVGE
jgi:hypothetical protein